MRDAISRLDKEGMYDMEYEAPTLTEVGSVRGLTLGLDSWQEWNDETYFWGQKIPLPGTGDGVS